MQVFVVGVSVHDGVWVAECDALGLVTEADNFEALVERAWEIAPELAELNGFPVTPEEMQLEFHYTASTPLRQAAG